jgi:hypothetical protein
MLKLKSNHHHYDQPIFFAKRFHNVSSLHFYFLIINEIYQSRCFDGHHCYCHSVQRNLEQNLTDPMVAVNNLVPNFARLILIARCLNPDFDKILDCLICLFCNYHLYLHFDPDDAAAGRSDYIDYRSLGGLSISHR